jgi:two-component sensor histidine kinase
VVEATLSSIRHRVVNDFSLVHALLGMAMRKTHDAQAVRLFQASRSRVRVIALLHAVVWRPEYERPNGVDAMPYLTEVVREMERSGGAHERVRVEVETNGIALAIADMAAVGLCASELVHNALHHAFPGERRGSVRVTLAACESSPELLLRVTDDGVGISPGAGESTTGLGLALVRLLAEQLAGKLTFGSNGGNGTDFCLRFASTTESSVWPTS